jgi:cell division protein FtsB
VTERRRTGPKRPKAQKEKPARRRHLVRGALLAALLIGVLFVFVYPTRSFLAQRDQVNQARAQLDLLRTETAKLDTEKKKLNEDDEIARIAREFYGLVKPGETPFVILPAPTTTTAPPATGAGATASTSATGAPAPTATTAKPSP